MKRMHKLFVLLGILPLLLTGCDSGQEVEENIESQNPVVSSDHHFSGGHDNIYYGSNW